MSSITIRNLEEGLNAGCAYVPPRGIIRWRRKRAISFAARFPRSLGPMTILRMPSAG